MKNIVWPQKRLNLFHGAVLASMILYAVLIAKVDVASLPDLYAPLRFLISSMGCLVLFNFVFRMTLNPSDKIVKFLNWGGQKTLEIYVVHYVVMGFLKNSGASVLTVLGFSEFIVNLIIVIVVTILFVEIIDSNQYSKKILFGKFKF